MIYGQHFEIAEYTEVDRTGRLYMILRKKLLIGIPAKLIFWKGVYFRDT